MKRIFFVIMMLVVPILSFGAEPNTDINTQVITELASKLACIQYYIPWLSPLYVILALAFLVPTLITAYITWRFNTKLEKFRFEFRVREQATVVAACLAEARGGETEDQKKLNRLTWEVSLWLPSELVKELTKQLCKHEDAKPVKEILIEVRKHILGLCKTDLVADDITSF